jgi:hypothetical protein
MYATEGDASLKIFTVRTSLWVMSEIVLMNGVLARGSELRTRSTRSPFSKQVRKSTPRSVNSLFSSFTESTDKLSGKRSPSEGTELPIRIAEAARFGRACPPYIVGDEAPHGFAVNVGLTAKRSVANSSGGHGLSAASRTSAGLFDHTFSKISVRFLLTMLSRLPWDWHTLHAKISTMAHILISMPKNKML